MLVHRARNRMADRRRQCSFQLVRKAACAFVGQSIANVIVAGFGTERPGDGAGLIERRRNPPVRLGGPGAKMMKTPFDAGERRAVMTFGMRHVRQVRVLQQMNRSQFPLFPVFREPSDCERILEDTIDAESISRLRAAHDHR